MEVTRFMTVGGVMEPFGLAAQYHGEASKAAARMWERFDLSCENRKDRQLLREEEGMEEEFEFTPVRLTGRATIRKPPLWTRIKWKLFPRWRKRQIEQATKMAAQRIDDEILRKVNG